MDGARCFDEGTNVGSFVGSRGHLPIEDGDASTTRGRNILAAG
jgi:hypothetical protein